MQQRQLAARLAVLAATLAVVLATTSNARISTLPTFKSRMTLLLVCIPMCFVSSSEILPVGWWDVQLPGLQEVCPASWWFYLHPASLMLQRALHMIFGFGPLEISKFGTYLCCQQRVITIGDIVRLLSTRASSLANSQVYIQLFHGLGVLSPFFSHIFLSCIFCNLQAASISPQKKQSLLL